MRAQRLSCFFPSFGRKSSSRDFCTPLRDSTPSCEPNFGLSRNEISRLPLVSFPGKIHLISNEQDLSSSPVRDALDELENSTTLGVDTESAVSFKKGQSPKLALLQISNDETAIAFRLHAFADLPPPFRRILTGSAVKVFHAAMAEARCLYQNYGTDLCHVVDTLAFGQQLDAPLLRLVDLAAIFLNCRISKSRSVRLSNWMASELSPLQISYAATDAWMTRKVYLAMRRYADERGISVPAPMQSFVGHLATGKTKGLRRIARDLGIPLLVEPATQIEDDNDRERILEEHLREHRENVVKKTTLQKSDGTYVVTTTTSITHKSND